MFDIRTKFKRIAELRRLVGLAKAVGFELTISLRIPEARLRVPGYPSDFTVRRDDSDYSVFASIFLDDELSTSFAREPSTTNRKLVSTAGSAYRSCQTTSSGAGR
jgi:hypothetical protein